jgi:hypothetical protein
MTNKTEDKFYFQQSKFVVCVLFGGRCVFQNAYATLSQAQSEAKKAHAKYGQVGNEYLPTAKGTVEIREYQGSNLISQHKFSRPGQPERFTKYIPIKSWTRGSTKYEAGIMEDAGRFQPYVNMPESGILLTRSAPTFKTETGAKKWLESYMQKMNASRPDQPEKFDASSLDRGSFAEASTSPMLGKLLSAKVMPEGGWRAVQAGSDTLVISFEDADLARDFGRRVATKGYNATSPVQAIGRYWNVEVNNGK